MTDLDGSASADEAGELGDGYNPDDPADSQPAEPWHVAFVEWVQSHFATVEFFTGEAKIRWCPTWWVHPEAVARLKALWSAYLGADVAEGPEAAAAMSNWWLHHWDPHREVLFHDKGPFRSCDVEHGHLWSSTDRRVLPVPETPPESWDPPA
jgi:hypothetical protein